MHGNCPVLFNMMQCCMVIVGWRSDYKRSWNTTGQYDRMSWILLLFMTMQKQIRCYVSVKANTGFQSTQLLANLGTHFCFSLLENWKMMYFVVFDIFFSWLSHCVYLWRFHVWMLIVWQQAIPTETKASTLYSRWSKFSDFHILHCNLWFNLFWRQ